MSDDIAPSGQAPDSAPVVLPVVPAAAQAVPAETQESKELSKANAEAAKWRVQLRETEQALKAVQAQAGDNKALSDQLAKLQADLAAKAAEAETAQKLAYAMRVAAKAGVDPDIVAMLDLSKIDPDEKKASEQLAKLAGAGRGAQVKPGAINNSGDTDAELRAMFFGHGGPRKSSIFGG